MNKRIDFTNLGGYPLAQEDLDWLQSSYRGALSAMSNLIGDKVIISGMVEAGGNVSAGWVSIAGELVPFEAGAIGTGEFRIDEQATPLTFNDGNDHAVLIERIAKFGAGGPYSYADLRRIGTLMNAAVPMDGIIMWSGLVANIPVNYKLCDGTNGTPDLQGKMIVGYNPADAQFNTVGNTGGNKTATLLNANLPPIAIERPKKINDVDRGGGPSNWSIDNIEIINVGGTSDPFSVMNPYYVLAFIQRKS
jgi:hypothetical protein